jgi:hypothetical protein
MTTADSGSYLWRLLVLNLLHGILIGIDSLGALPDAVFYLQVSPEDDQLGPVEPAEPKDESGSSAHPTTEEQGPVLDEFGPSTSAIEIGPSKASMARSESK